MADQTAAVIVIGDEILSGKTVDENARFLIQELRELGVALRRILILPDVVDEIAAAVRDFSARYDHVFTSGGVGPTHDDLTMEGVARAFDTEIVRHPDLEQLLRRHYGSRLEERNLRMADVPRGTTLVQTEQLPWPVITYRNVYILPGIPEIFRRKFLAVRERFRQRPYHLVCVYADADEGEIAAQLDVIAARYPDVPLGSYPKLSSADGWRVKLTLESKEPSRVHEAAVHLRELLGTKVVKVD